MRERERERIEKKFRERIIRMINLDGNDSLMLIFFLKSWNIPAIVLQYPEKKENEN